MENILSMLYTFYITPHIEEEGELLGCVAALCPDLTPRQKEQCEQIQKLCAEKAFLLGIRAGAGIERFLSRDLT